MTLSFTHNKNTHQILDGAWAMREIHGKVPPLELSENRFFKKFSCGKKKKFVAYFSAFMHRNRKKLAKKIFGIDNWVNSSTCGRTSF
jgi:hypothetical protein